MCRDRFSGLTWSFAAWPFATWPFATWPLSKILDSTVFSKKTNFEH